MTLLLALGLLLFALPSASATHSVCDSEPFPGDIHVFGAVGVDTGLTGSGVTYVCVGSFAVGVADALYTGPSYGATVDLQTCNGTAATCSSLVDNTGVVLVPDDAGSICINAQCYRVQVCVDNQFCP
jgi:hypothetical protein